LVALLGQVETAIVDVFRHRGGVDYSAFERFHALMAESSRTTLQATLLNRTLPLVSGLTDRLVAGVDVLDVGCGPLAQGGEGLGACWGEEKAREVLAEAGFTAIEVSRVESDPLNAYYVCRPQEQ
jgi:hypothetical protein